LEELMKQSWKAALVGLPLAIVTVATVSTAFAHPATPDVHERKEVAGLSVVFGVEPEPALTEEMQFLRWRIKTLADEEVYTDLKGASVTIHFQGEEYGPYAVRGARGTPGQYQSRHIFTAAGDYEAVLSFKKGEETEVHSVDFGLSIRDRSSMEIPPRGGGN
jgi:hypothetical protein